MKQFKLQCNLEPLQLVKKEKCKAITIDYYELFIGLIDFGNKLHIMSLNTLNQLFTIEIQMSDDCQLTFGYKSQFVAVYSTKEIFIYQLQEDIIFLQKIAIQDLIIKFEFHPSLIDNYYILTQQEIADKNISIAIEQPIDFLSAHNQKYTGILLTFDSIQLLCNLEVIHNLQLDNNKKLRMKFDEQDQMIALFELNIISILQIQNAQTKIKYNKVQQKVERIFDGCFFQLPFYKQNEYFGDKQFVYFAMSKGKLGSMICSFDMDGDPYYEQMTHQERKCKLMIPIYRWGNNILGWFDQGYLNRIQLYKLNQFEKLEFKFSQLLKNEIYEEQENEFDKKLKQPQKALDRNQFTQNMFDPYNTYIKLN